MALSEETMSKCSEHLRAYKSACQDHPDLKSFDSLLQQRTIKAIDSLTTKAQTGTGFTSQHDIHMEVSKNLVEVSKDVANFIVESEDTMWESRALRSLVKTYFENTKKTLEIFDNVMECVENAEMGQHYIEEAVSQFDKESAAVQLEEEPKIILPGFPDDDLTLIPKHHKSVPKEDSGHKKKRYESTLKELKKFKAMGDPFNGQLLTNQIKLIQKQQESLLQEVSEAKTKLDEEIKELAQEYADAQKGSFISNIIFGAAFCVAAVGSICLIATGVGAVFGAAGIAGLGVIAVGWAGVDIYLRGRIDALKRQQEALQKMKDAISSVEAGIETNEFSLEDISELVRQLEDKILDLMKYVDDALGDEDETDTEFALNSIRKKVQILTEKIKEVGESVSKHSKLIMEARLHVLEKISGTGKYIRG